MIEEPDTRLKVYMIKMSGSFYLDIDENSPVYRFDSIQDAAYEIFTKKYAKEIEGKYNRDRYVYNGLQDILDIDYSKLSKEDYKKLMYSKLVELL